MKKIIICAVLVLLMPELVAQQALRLKENFDFDWKFSLDSSRIAMDADFDDSGWEDIQLPHDWSIKLPFDRKAGGAAGFLPGGIGSYRKSFKIPASYREKKVLILFDGVYHQSEVFINGHRLGFHPYGYTGFEYDLTPYLNFGGDNLIAVRVDHSDSPTSRWYSGSGIYRHVWLQVVNPVHVSTWGTYVTTPVVDDQHAEINIVTTIENTSLKPQKIIVSQRIFDKEIGRASCRERV